MTIKYLQYGLTRDQDQLLGAFGENDRWSLTLEGLWWNRDVNPHTVANQLEAKGLLKSNMQDDGTFLYTLTPRGKELWNARNQEELEGPQ